MYIQDETKTQNPNLTNVCFFLRAIFSKPFYFLKYLTYNLSLPYPYIIQQTDYENTQTYQVEVLSLSNTKMCSGVRGELIIRCWELKG